MSKQLSQRGSKGRFVTGAAITSALGRAGKKVSPWRFGVPWLKRPTKPHWVK